MLAFKTSRLSRRPRNVYEQGNLGDKGANGTDARGKRHDLPPSQTEQYLQTRKSLKRVMLLMDARLPLKASDVDTIDMLER